jgi:hypothetical protein
VRLVQGSAIAVLALAVSSGPALAGDPPAPDFDKSLARAAGLVDEEKWADGEAALRKLFTDFPGDARVTSRLREIEDDLKVCMFRRFRGPVTGTDLFGSAAKSFSPATREVVLEFRRFDEPLWRTYDNGLQCLEVRFEGSQTIEVAAQLLNHDHTVAGFVVCYDIEKRGGYIVTTGCNQTEGTMVYSAPPTVAKLLGGKSTPLKNSAKACDYPWNAVVTITRTGGDLTAKVGNAAVVRTNDTTFTTGYFGMRADDVSSVTVHARVDKHAYRKMIAERFAKQFAEWEKCYDRNAELPAWAREAPVAGAPDMTLDDLPADASPDLRRDYVDALERAAGGDVESVRALRTLAAEAPANTARYLDAVADLTAGRTKAASDALDLLADAEPEFVPARLFRGLARYAMRRVDEAKADLAWVITNRPRSALAHVVTAEIAMYEQDIDTAAAVVERAAAMGVGSPEIARVRDWVHRVKKGPNLTQRFEHETEHFIVVSDHSKKVCFDAATLLETMQPQYAALYRPAPVRSGRNKARVYVFSGRQGYLDYAADLNVPADSTAGVYLPMLRELVMWIPLDMTDFTNTVRHEGFHQYLHRLVESAPIWFNEGNAEFMGGGGPEGLRNAKRDGVIVQAFTPLRLLVALKPREFMAQAEVCYTESRYLVDFLRRTKHEKLKTLLADYFKAISDGLSQEDANAKVLQPVMDVLQAEFTRSL